MTADTQIRELQQIVLEKDDLLKVLTERLELAAEQLDRLRRQGNVLEPHHHTPPPTKPNSLESTPGVVDDLRQMLADWQDLQSKDWFAALEERMEGIHELVSHLQSAPVRSQPEEHRSPSVADMLSKYSHADDAKPHHSQSLESADEPPDLEVDAPSATLELPELPPAIDVEFGSTEELREGLRKREEYIRRLRDYLLAFDSVESASIESVDIGPLTAEQREAMEAWEAKVRKDLRQTQIQLWVERAQLSREQMQAQQLQQQLDTETRRLGLSNAGGVNGAKGDDSHKSKNWLGLFGSK